MKSERNSINPETIKLWPLLDSLINEENEKEDKEEIVTVNYEEDENSLDGGLEGFFSEIGDVLTEEDEEDKGFTSYDLISRTLHQLTRDGKSELLATALDRLGSRTAQKINLFDEDQLTPLHYAARYSHTQTIKTLLNFGADVNAKGEDDLTPLHFAARYRKTIKAKEKPSVRIINLSFQEPVDLDSLDSYLGSESLPNGRSPLEESVVQVLVENGADVNARDIYGQTPLHFAAMRGNHIAASDLLLCPGVNVEAMDKQLMTPLATASTFGYIEIVQQLFDSGANLLVWDDARQTPLHNAASEGHLKIAEMILDVACQKGGDELILKLVRAKNMENQTALHAAVINGHKEIAERLLTAGADVDSLRNTLATPLHSAAVVGDTDVIQLLVKHSAKIMAVDCNHQTPLHRAAAYNQAAAVRMLLTLGAKIERRDGDSCTPLLIAAAAGHVDAMKALLDNNAEVTVHDKDDKSCIFCCAQQGHADALTFLLQYNECRGLIDFSDRYDNSPLHEAAKRGYLETTIILLENGAQIDNKNEDEDTPLHVAARAGQTEIVRELMRRHRVMNNDENANANTPLHVACLSGHQEVVQVLLEAGADVEARNSSLWTPLDCASAKGHELCCQLLIKYDAKLNPIDKTKTTPLQLAARGDHVEVIKLLLERGANVSAVDVNKRNALEIAISVGNRDAAIAIIKSNKWKDALRNKKYYHNKEKKCTPFRMLIRKFPDIAELVLDKCTSTNGEDCNEKEFGLKFDYEFIDDTYTMSSVPTDRKHSDQVSSLNLNSAFDEEGRLHKEATTYTKDARSLKKNHPLMLMARHKRMKLLGHPVTVSLVRHKWNKYGREWTWKEEGTLQGGESNSGATPNSKKSCEEVEDPETFAQNVFVIAGKWVIIVLAGLHILRELFQFYQLRLNYIGLVNLLEWVCYASAVLVVVDFEGCVVRKDWQWQLASLTVFLSWSNLILFIRKLPVFGIYVVMFIDVLATFAQFFAVFFLFITAFALGFYIVLKGNYSFESPQKSLLKTTVMMIGEFEYTQIFNDPDHPINEDYAEMTYILFVLFLVVMSILLMNLLVGLAVDNIKAVQEEAMMKRLALQAELVMEVEVLIPEALRRHYALNYKICHPNIPQSRLFSAFYDFSLISSPFFDRLKTTGFVDEEEDTLVKKIDILSVQIQEIKQNNKKLQALLTLLNHQTSHGENKKR